MNAVPTNISINPTIPKIRRIQVLEAILIISSIPAITLIIALIPTIPMHKPSLNFFDFKRNNNPGR